MSFDNLTVGLLQYYTSNPPSTAGTSSWYGPWTSILINLFPSKEGFVVNPHRRPSVDRQIPVFEILKLTSTSPVTFRTVLVVEIKNTNQWQTGIPALEQQLTMQTDAAFAGAGAFVGTAHAEVYWIGAIGPHWRYGKKDQADGLVPLIEWHHTIHDAASYADLQELAALVHAL